MNTPDPHALQQAYDRDGFLILPHFLTPAEVATVRAELTRYTRDDLPNLPPDAATFEADGQTVRNLWRLERYNSTLRALAERPELLALVRTLLHGDPVLAAIETFNKPARIGSGVPYHQDNAYFCQAPPDMLTVWIALDPVTHENGPVYYIPGSHRLGVLPTKPSGVRGNSIGLAEPPATPRAEQYCALLAPGDASIHHCNTIHHSDPNPSPHSRLGFLFVFRGAHTATDETLRSKYAAAVALTPPS
jgi:ectoine hydroxylase-related dioxygenase (phytanoyl-CoA dioxygenase family)